MIHVTLIQSHASGAVYEPNQYNLVLLDDPFLIVWVNEFKNYICIYSPKKNML